MDYAAHYARLIKRGKERKLDGYFEVHHIMPRCMGGSDDPSNLVELTPEEHLIAHKLLVQIHPDNVDLITTVFVMSGGRKGRFAGNKVYGWLKRRFSERRKGYKHAEETKQKMSAASKGKPKSEAHRKRLSEVRTGKSRGPHSEEHKRNLSAGIKSALKAKGRAPYFDDPKYQEIQRQRMKDVWAKRKAGELKLPKNNKQH